MMNELRCSVCSRPFVPLSGNVQGCAVHGIRLGVEVPNDYEREFRRRWPIAFYSLSYDGEDFELRWRRRSPSGEAGDVQAVSQNTPAGCFAAAIEREEAHDDALSRPL